MDPPGLGIYRRRTLTNSAAEFVETGAGMDIVAQIIDSDDLEEVQAASEFVPELDQFVPKGWGVDIEKCYQESQKRMAKFQQTLENFVRLLRERNVDKELNVEIKNPDQLTMEDALSIISKIQEGRDTKEVKSCKDFIYKCYRKAESKRGIADAVLTMIPNDAYGSVISGGFTLILAAVEKHAEHRSDMQNFLSEIPEQLEKLHRLSQIHLNSLRVHAQRDAVLVSIFVVLERIVNHLTQSWRGKVKNKVKVIFGNSKSKPSTDLVTTTGEAGPTTDPGDSKQTVSEAINDFRKEVARFQEEVDVADSERLGRQLNREELAREEQRRRQQSLLDATPTSPPSFQTSNQEVLEKWLRRLGSRTGLLTYDYLDDARVILTSQQRLDLDEIDQCNYISWSCREYKAWLKVDLATSPSLLLISLRNPPGIHNPINALSFTTARTAIMFRMQQGTQRTGEMKPHSPKWPVLAFFCRQRNMASRNVDISGAPALVRSLCAQLLEWIALFRPRVDLATCIKNRDFFRGAREDIDDALRLFRALLVVLRDENQKQNREQPNPPVQPVWIVIEGLSCLTVAQSTSESHNMIAMLWRIIEEVSRSSQRSSSAPGLAIKLMVTDAFGTSPINKTEGQGVYGLHVPDTPTVAGGARGVLDGGDAARQFSQLVGRHLARDKSNSDQETAGSQEEEGEEEEEVQSDEDDSSSDDRRRSSGNRARRKNSHKKGPGKRKVKSKKKDEAESEGGCVSESV
ncbi:hypothetical protein V8F20_008679 [Naviculisporaceae sp. PSN 640]